MSTGGSTTPTTINCKTCGLAITAKRNGRVTIWLEANGRKHACAGTAPQAANSQPKAAAQAVAEAIIDLNSIYDALREEDELAVKAAAEAAEEKASKQAAAKAAAYTVTVADGQVPVLDGDYLIEESQLAAIKRVIGLADAGRPQNIGLHGPAGSGKTTLGLQIGALRKSPTFICEAAGKQTADEWYCTTTGVVEGKIQTVASHFVTGIETENAVVVLNDVALLQDRTVQNGLNELLDPSTRSTFVEQLGRRVSVAKGVIIVGTWNVGSEYTGASELSLQLLDRFRSGALFELPYPDDGALAHILAARSGLSRKKADELSLLSTWMRGDSNPIPVSTRGLIAAATHVAQGATYGEAISFTVFGELDEFERQRAYGIINKHRPAKPEWATPKRGNYIKLG